MNAEEPIQAINQNQSVSTTGKPLQEQARVTTTPMPRQISFLSLIYQWQPMGCRVVLNLPFVGNDRDYLFYIRNGPFIPIPPNLNNYLDDAYRDNPDSYQGKCSTYAWNNMRPVFLFRDSASDFPDFDDPTKDFPVTLTQYDMPPIISTIAQAFRRWRGDMQYRIRVVAGFATQGYIIVTPLKNVFVPVGVYDPFKVAPEIKRQDLSYKPSMMNSYALADTSMYRHIEVTFPYDYPTSYYDQYAWMSRRTSPSTYFAVYQGAAKPPVKPVQQDHGIESEPHGDNFIGIGLRGNLAATQTGSQIEFELEYRCAEGFQFADPFLLPWSSHLSTRHAIGSDALPVAIPSRSRTTDGIGLMQKPASTRSTARLLGLSSRSG